MSLYSSTSLHNVLDSLHPAETAAEGDHEEEEDETDGAKTRTKDDVYLLFCQNRILCTGKESHDI